MTCQNRLCGVVNCILRWKTRRRENRLRIPCFAVNTKLTVSIFNTFDHSPYHFLRKRNRMS